MAYDREAVIRRVQLGAIRTMTPAWHLKEVGADKSDAQALALWGASTRPLAEAIVSAVEEMFR